MSIPLPQEPARSVVPSFVSAFPSCAAHRRGPARSARLRRFLVAFGLMAAAGFVQAQTSFTPQAVGSSSTLTVSVTASKAGTVNTVRVLTSGSAGLDFVAGSGGTCSGAGLIAGQQCSQSVTFTPANPGVRSGAVVLLDSSNNVLGTTYLSGSGTGGVGVIIPGTAQTIAGDGAWQDANVGDGNQATQAELFLPTAVALDGAGNVYIADSNHNRIRMVCAGTTATIAGTNCSAQGVISTVAGGGVGGVALNTPSGVTVDGAGNLYIADTGNHVVRELEASTGTLLTVAGTGSEGSSGDGGAATSAKLSSPYGLAFDGNGNLYISDVGNDRIRAVCGGTAAVLGVACAARGTIVTVAGVGTQGALGDGGPAIAAQLDSPYSVALDASGNLFIADTQNNKVRAVCASASSSLLGTACTAAGVISTVVGDGTGNFQGDGGSALAAEVNSPSGLAFDAAGNLYIADTQNNRVRKVNASTGIITTVFGNGGDYGGDAGSALVAGIHGPYGMAFYTAGPTSGKTAALAHFGDLLVTDFFDQRVRQVQANLSVVNVQTPVRQGSVSATTQVTVENDGTGPLAVTTIDLAGNAATDSAVTTCTNGGSLAVDATCIVGAQFAPAATPTLTGNQQESGDIDVNYDTVASILGSNSPLDIQVNGTATPVNATTVTLTSTPNPSVFNQSVKFSAAVTTGAGTGNLTGTVTFYDGKTVLQSAVALNASGVATFASSALTIGTHSITAAYNGDPLHFPDTSDPLKQVVNEATSTVLASSANPSALNTAVTFTATVTAVAGTVPPDGTVTFMDGSNVLTTVPLTAAGTATFSTSTLSDGLHAITAVFSGDPATYVLGSTSAVLNQDVLAASNVVLTSSLNPSNYGLAVTFTATVTANGTVAPTGTVNILDGGQQIGTATLIGTTGVATFVTSGLAAGTHSITAQYLGSPNDGPGTSPAISQVVNQTQTSTALSATPSPGIAGKPVALTATVTIVAGSAAITGPVTFTDNGTALGTANLAANGTATLNPVLAPGVHSIVATYGGDVNDKGSVSVALSLTINQATTQVALTSNGSPAVVLAPVVFKAVVSGNGGIPTGTVTFAVDGTSAGSATVDATGTASFTDSGLAVGSHNVVATYAGDVNDAGSASVTLTQVITAIPTTTNLGSSSTGGTQPQPILVATTLATTGPTPTGTITFSNGSKVIGSAPLDSNGVATLTPDLAPGTYSITASYGGDALHSPSSSAAVTINGTATGFSIIVNPSKMTLVTGQNGTFNITLQSNSGFADSIGMGCLSLPAAVNCHFSSNSVNLAKDGTATVQLTLDTNAPLSGGGSASIAGTKGGGIAFAGIFWPLGLLLGGLVWRFRRKHAAALVAALALFLAGAFAMTGCGAGFSQVSAAPGTYTIQVGGVGTNSNISHYQPVTLVVTK